MQPVDNRDLSTGAVRSGDGSTKPFGIVFPDVHNAYYLYKESI
jgi:hypothetical protein